MANFKLDVDVDGIALITWDMPGRSMNVIDFAVVDELDAMVEKVAADAAIKGAVITSGKDTFGGGADLTMLEKQREDYVATLSRRARKPRTSWCSSAAASSRRSIASSRPAASRGSRRSTAPRWAAASSSRSPAITASRRTIRRRGSACPRSRSGCSPAPAARNASRA